MTAIKEKFQKAKVNGEGLLIGYITAGDPTPEQTPKIADALIRGGVDILELGLPFSDPLADGPTIQEASLRALNAGTTPLKVLDIARQIKAKHNIPLVVMTYYNPVFHLGVDSFLSQAKTVGVDGFIVPDLPVEEASAYQKAAKMHKIDTIFLATPATSNDRLRKIVDSSLGFLYLVSRFGVTGAQTSVTDSTLQLIKHVQPSTVNKIPLAVGFGISKPEHVRRIIAAGADAAIVGSAFINIIKDNIQDLKAALVELQAVATELKSASKL
ncbi:MAG: tryptophan synthase subunit alpha [Nitrososphaerota archaeon]|jgi:tryptophan synthase alpha chain|nr:tryptophan synthase subunit alpha [Nitrososphaerota archaeon]